jgi:serine/threonine protein kinase
MVPYRDATEIPAFVVMDWVEGPNLQVAKESRMIATWDEVLWVSLALARTLKHAHDLPERVLHRDVRPANVMLRGGWSGSGTGDWELVVLDFDLSTFRGARQKSVLAENSALGYLAPEQLRSNGVQSTRSAAVDSFGLGMTLLFLCSGEEPEPYLQRHAHFHETVRRSTTELEAVEWVSLPRRFERLVLGAVADDQRHRWDMAQVIRELDRLKKAHDTPEAVGYNDLLCEEIASRCAGMQSYSWDSDKEFAAVSRPGGLHVELRGPSAGDQIDLSIDWTATGVEDRAGIARYLPKRLEQATASLRKGPWQVNMSDHDRASLRLTAALARKGAQNGLSSAAASLGTALGQLDMQAG